MPNPKPQTPRSQRTDPPTPRPRSKSKSSRARPSQKKGNGVVVSAAPSVGSVSTPGITSVPAVPVSFPHTPTPLLPNLTPPLPVLPLPTLPLPSPAPLTPTTAPNTPGASGTGARSVGSKRSRPASLSRDSDLKRSKSTLTPRPPLTPTPASPTTSSRSRPRSRKRSGASITTVGTSATDTDFTSASHVLSAATSAAARTRPNTKRANRAVSGPPPPNAALLALDGVPLLPIVKHTWLSRRLFGREIQCLMHAFGEVRNCTRDVLEIMEDAARETVIRVCHRLTERDAQVTVAAVAGILRADPSASLRMQQTLKRSTDNPDNNSLLEAVPFFNRPWEDIVDLGHLNPHSEPFHSHLATSTYQYCLEHASRAFHIVMGPNQFGEFYKCRDVVLVRSDSRASSEMSVDNVRGKTGVSNGSDGSKIRGKTRLALFREWLGPTLENVQFSEESLLALGHIAWESIGTITQTALFLRYMNDLDRGMGNPRALDWTYGRHVIEMLAHGLATAILIPLSELQVRDLGTELKSFYDMSAAISKTWRTHAYASSTFLLPEHITDAIQKLGCKCSQKGLWGQSRPNFMLFD